MGMPKIIKQIKYSNGKDEKILIVREYDTGVRYCVFIGKRGGNYKEYKTFDGVEKALHNAGYKKAEE